MALDELLISTGVDNLIRLVHQKGRVELAAAAKELGLQVETLENWAHVLEEENIIKIEYKLTKIYLVWVSPDPSTVEAKAVALDSKKGELVQNINETLHKVQDTKGELDLLKTNLKEILKSTQGDSQLIQRVQNLKKMEKGVDQIYEKYANKIGKVKEGLKQMEGQLEQIESGGLKKPKIAQMLVQLTENLDAAKAEYAAFKKQVEDEISKFEGEVLSEKVGLEEELKRGQLLLAKVESATKRKNEVQSAIGQIESLAQSRENLESQLLALSKKAQVLSLQATTAQMEKMVQAKAEEIEEKYSLSAKEAAEFEDKRGELRELIRKIWNETA
ncbi:hypothetical protein FJZ26_03075 [Candidatus Parvarchaeota archaeon]|nr:hypothetical protein [Candidatus Parvarchaeota archaeon]